MQRNTFPVFRYAVSSAFIALTAFLGYIVPRANFPLLLASYTLLFALYAFILLGRRWHEPDRRWFIGLGIALRVLLLFSVPNLSDDFYRFIWDGRLTTHGIHPFAHPPVYFMKNQPAIPGITTGLFHQLNSPDYFTVYPPVCQALFWLAARIFPESILGSVFILKLFLLGCEAGTIYLLFNPKGQVIGTSRALLYALNPLALFEVVGNCHFEGAMLFFLIAGLQALTRGRAGRAGVFWALAVASKLLPLLVLPVVLVQLGWRQGMRFLLFFTGSGLLLFLPVLDIQLILNIAASLKLYFRQFEFNASWYYVLKEIGIRFASPKTDVARTLGPVLAAVVAAGVVSLAGYQAIRKRMDAGFAPSLPGSLLLVFMFYLTLATTVHPWYIVPVFGISLFTNRVYPLVWTAAAIFSYSHYNGGGFQEHPFWIALEYAAVFGTMAYESVWPGRLFRSFEKAAPPVTFL